MLIFTFPHQAVDLIQNNELVRKGLDILVKMDSELAFVHRANRLIVNREIAFSEEQALSRENDIIMKFRAIPALQAREAMRLFVRECRSRSNEVHVDGCDTWDLWPFDVTKLDIFAIAIGKKPAIVKRYSDPLKISKGSNRLSINKDFGWGALGPFNIGPPHDEPFFSRAMKLVDKGYYDVVDPSGVMD